MGCAELLCTVLCPRMQEFEQANRHAERKKLKNRSSLSGDPVRQTRTTVSPAAEEAGSSVASHEMQVVSTMDLQEKEGALPPVAVYVAVCHQFLLPPSHVMMLLLSARMMLLS